LIVKEVLAMFKIEGKFLCGYILALSLFFLNEIFISRIFLLITLLIFIQHIDHQALMT
jgi:hypothetical protein